MNNLRLTLFQKGLFVVAFVFCIQLAFLYYYGTWLSDAEFLWEQEFHSKSVIGRCNWISALLAANNSAGFAYLASDDKEALNIYQATRASLPSEMAGLAKEIEDNAEQRARAGQSVELVEKILKLMDGVIVDQKSPIEKQQLAQLIHLQLLPEWAKLRELRHEMIEAAFARYRVTAEALPSGRKSRSEWVHYLVIVDFLAAAGILAVYTQGLTLRLATLAENARRFADKQPLKPMVAGADEITEVDKAFHEMSDSLHLAQKRKQEFVSMISHDMRTPLTNVQASLEFVLENTAQLPEETRVWLNRAYGNVDTVLNLINELLEIERMEEGQLKLEFSEVQIADLVRKSVDVVRATAEQKSIAIVEPKLQGYLRCDDARIIRVLVNLLGNALKFSPPNSTITIDCVATTNWLELSVSDQGRGIPAEFIATVFERFQQVSVEDARKLGGSGLGLAISKAIVEAHGGMIMVTSEEGKGSTFKISLPADLVSDEMESPETD